MMSSCGTKPPTEADLVGLVMDVGTVEPDEAGGDSVDTGDRFEQRRLAAATRPDHRELSSPGSITNDMWSSTLRLPRTAATSWATSRAPRTSIIVSA